MISDIENEVKKEHKMKQNELLGECSHRVFLHRFDTSQGNELRWIGKQNFIHVEGAVKITPAHDYTDFDIGQRHNLPSRSIISNAGTMENCSELFLGLKRFDCRKELGKVLADKGLLRESESHAMSVPVCR